MDFFTVEVLTLTGLVRKHVLFLIDIATRCVTIAVVVDEPDGRWIEQRAKDLSDPRKGFLRNIRYLIHDRSRVFTDAFREILSKGGTTCIRLPPMSPNMNAYAERFVLSIKSELLDRVVILGEGHLRQLLREYVTHYHHECPHQGLGNRIVIPEHANDEPPSGAVVRRSRLGELLNDYRRRSQARSSNGT